MKGQMAGLKKEIDMAQDEYIALFRISYKII
jgi:hypothetical protein